MSGSARGGVTTSGSTATMPDREALVAALREWGVGFVGPSDARPGPAPLDPAVFIPALATHPDPRLRSALVVAFVRNGGWPDVVRRLVAEPDDTSAAAVKLAYTTSVCLERMWAPRLGLYIDGVPRLPDLFGAELGLRAVAERHGKLCLHEIAERMPFNFLSSLDGMMAQLFWQLRLERREAERAAAG